MLKGFLMSRKQKVSKTKDAAQIKAEDIQKFIDDYNALCAKHGLKLTANPSWEADGPNSWHLVLKMGVSLFNPEPTAPPSPSPVPLEGK